MWHFLVNKISCLSLLVAWFLASAAMAMPDFMLGWPALFWSTDLMVMSYVFGWVGFRLRGKDLWPSNMRQVLNFLRGLAMAVSPAGALLTILGSIPSLIFFLPVKQPEKMVCHPIWVTLGSLAVFLVGWAFVRYTNKYSGIT